MGQCMSNFIIKYNTDIFTFESDVLIQGCNCFNTMGAGIAKEIKRIFPDAWKADLATIKGDKNKLGTFTFSSNKTKPYYIVNLYTQYTYWDKQDMFYVDAFYKGMASVIDFFISKRAKANKENKTITFSLPAIGLGLANGKPEDIFLVLKNLEKKYEKDNIIIALCLHKKDINLNDIFKNLQSKYSKNKSS